MLCVGIGQKEFLSAHSITAGNDQFDNISIFEISILDHNFNPLIPSVQACSNELLPSECSNFSINESKQFTSFI